ncbi:unnamed protein product, partial [Ectocarpus sp. 12 AP-2014]
PQISTLTTPPTTQHTITRGSNQVRGMERGGLAGRGNRRSVSISSSTSIALVSVFSPTLQQGSMGLNPLHMPFAPAASICFAPLRRNFEAWHARNQSTQSVLSNNPGNCAASRAHTCHNPNRTRSYIRGTGT